MCPTDYIFTVSRFLNKKFTKNLIGFLSVKIMLLAVSKLMTNYEFVSGLSSDVYDGLFSQLLLRVRPKLFDFPTKLSNLLRRIARNTNQAEQNSPRSHLILQSFHS